MFEAETYIERRSRLKKEIGSGLILFPGNDESPMNYADNTFPFRQDSSFLYFFGLDRPGLAGLIDADSGKETIFGDNPTVDDIVWMGAQPTLSDRCHAVGISTASPLSALDSVLDQAMKQNRKVHFLPPYRPENKIKLWRLLAIDPAVAGDAASIDLIRAVVNQRNYKTDEEIEEIEKAVNITVEMHLTAMRMARPGMVEEQIAASVHEVALAAGGDISFPVIATVHGEILHNHYHGHTLEKGQLFLLDAGAETGRHYAGDMSSTFPVDRTFTTRQKEIYQISLDAHLAAVDMLRPGVPFREVHRRACKTIAAGLKELGLMKGNIDDAVEQGAHALFFPCGTGHMIGLDVHDMEDLGEVYVGYDGKPKSTLFGLKSLRLARPLEPGFVHTIEPGIYFVPPLIDLWRGEGRFGDFIDYDRVDGYIDFGGIRNEEVYAITSDGARLLGNPLPKTIDEVETVR